ncbi:MAG: GIY-YIG nuclease family protein [bacterium]|nr:GIY-YIG nuclease family protein [bacterium]
MNDKKPGVYILTNKANSVLYTGATGIDLERIWQHKQKLVPGFTKKYNLDKLVYYEPCETIEQAFERERQIKNWHRQWKFSLIKKDNPNWLDIYDDFVKRS